MFCTQCDKDVADCICDDRSDRLTKLMNCKFIVLGSEYRARIQANIDKAKQQECEQVKTE